MTVYSTVFEEIGGLGLDVGGSAARQKNLIG